VTKNPSYLKIGKTVVRNPGKNIHSMSNPGLWHCTFGNMLSHRVAVGQSGVGERQAQPRLQVTMNTQRHVLPVKGKLMAKDKNKIAPSSPHGPSNH
jgi:hypothetical protein